MSTRQDNPIPAFRQANSTAAGFGLLGILALIAAFVYDRKSFYASFMFAWTFWGGLSIGAMTLTFLHHSIRAKWSLSILRFIEAANKTIFPMGLVFMAVMIPSIFSGQIYQWSDPATVAKSELLQRKAWLLNPWTYSIFTVFVFFYWAVMSNLLNGSTRRQEETGDETLAHKRMSYAPPNGVLHVILLTFAVTFWIMSLDPVWFSTIYGVWFMIQEMRCMIAFGAFILLALRFRRPFSEIVTPNVSGDLGWMLIGLSMFWAYVSLSQFLIIWSGNLPEEVTFYINRFSGWLVYFGAFLIIAQFLLPFLILLSYNVKRSPEQLKWVALWIVVMSALDIWWQITPFFRVGAGPEYLINYAFDLVAFAGIGGLWVWMFTRNLLDFAKEGLLIARHDARLIEAKLEMEAHHA